mgnify:CR=1 FL=1
MLPQYYLPLDKELDKVFNTNFFLLIEIFLFLSDNYHIDLLKRIWEVWEGWYPVDSEDNFSLRYSPHREDIYRGVRSFYSVAFSLSKEAVESLSLKSFRISSIFLIFLSAGL